MHITSLYTLHISASFIVNVAGLSAYLVRSLASTFCPNRRQFICGKRGLYSRAMLLKHSEPLRLFCSVYISAAVSVADPSWPPQPGIAHQHQQPGTRGWVLNNVCAGPASLASVASPAAAVSAIGRYLGWRGPASHRHGDVAQRRPHHRQPAPPSLAWCYSLYRSPPQPRLPASNLGGCWSWASLGTMLASAAQWLCPHRGEDAQCRAAGSQDQAWAGSCPLGPAQLCPAPAPVNY